MKTTNIKEVIKSYGDDAFERAMRKFNITPKEAEKLFKKSFIEDGIVTLEEITKILNTPM